MSFNLDVLFADPNDLHLETLSLSSSSIKAPSIEPTDGFWTERAVHDEHEGKHVEEARLRAMIANLNQQCEYWKTQAKERGNTIEELDRKTSKNSAGSGLPADAVRRLNHLESEVTRLLSENAQLKDTLKTIEYENVNLDNKNEDKTRKLKGANKKVKKAKDVAGKEDEKAKDAQSDKQRHLASERKMKKERGDALAALQNQTKLNGDLRAELEIEQSGAPHMRDTATDSNNTLAVVPIQLEIRRTDVQSIMRVLEWHQMNLTERFKEWYKERKVSATEVRKVVGSEGVDDEKKKLEKLYVDMVEMPDGYMETAAEHDGWRSKRAVQAVCRRAEARHNGEM
jgi:chromosome segregation ATPase